MTTFTDDDREKRVENANGEVIGTVIDVDGEAARVQPRSGMVDSIKAALGWRRTREDTVTIRADAVDEITPETVRLEATPTDGTTDTSTTPAEERAPPNPNPDAEPAADQRADAESPTGVDDRTAGAEAEPEPDVVADEPDQDRGVATDDSERGLETDDPNGELATGDPASGTDAVDEPIGSATPPEPGNGPNGEGGGKRERDRESERDREGAATDGSNERNDEFSTEPEEPNSSPIEPLTSSDIDGDEQSETGHPETNVDESEPSGSDGDHDAGDDSIDIADATATERPNRVGEPAIDDPVTEPDPASEAADSGETHADEETNLTDEPNIGSGTRSLEAVGGSTADADTNDGESRAESAASEGNLADEVDRGVDIESAVDDDDSDATAADAASTDPADELETGPDLEAAVESDESDDRTADGTSGERRGGSDDVAIEIEPGIDAASAMESAESTSTSDSESEPESGPAGQRVDVDTGPGTAMHRELTDADESTDGAGDTDGADDTDEAPDTSSDRTPRQSPQRESQDRSRSATGSAATAPVTAAIAAQRAALATTRTAAKLGATAQQNATRAAVTGPVLVQRGTLEFAQTAARSYTNGVAAMMGMETSTRTRRTDAETDVEQSMDAALANLEETHSQIADEELSQELAEHLERVRELRAADDEFDRRERIERATELLERQTELLRRCQQHLEEDERT